MIQLTTTSLTEINLALLGALSFLIAAYAGIKQKPDSRKRNLIRPATQHVPTTLQPQSTR